MVKHNEQLLGGCIGELDWKKNPKVFILRKTKPVMLTPQYPLIKDNNHLNYFLLQLLQLHFFLQRKHLFFPSSPMLVQAFNLHNTWISHKD